MKTGLNIEVHERASFDYDRVRLIEALRGSLRWLITEVLLAAALALVALLGLCLAPVGWLQVVAGCLAGLGISWWFWAARDAQRLYRELRKQRRGTW
jgi:Flp pilus assembly protein TadB